MSQPLVVITGASSGIGLATARAFAALNHPLLLISRNIEPTAELSDKPVDYARADVSDYDALQRAIRESEQRFGNTDCLKNMAITFEQYSHVLGDPDFMTADELADIILYCYRLPAHLCIRELVLAPTRTTF